MTEVGQMTGSATLAVIGSTGLQTVYHLYQGVLPALSLGCGFLLLSIYFARRRRIVPVVLAHLYFDVIALLVYGSR